MKGDRYGMIIMALVAAFAITVSGACIIKSNQVSRDAYVQDLSAGHMQTAADLTAVGGGDFRLLMDFYGVSCVSDGKGGVLVHFDGQMQPVEVAGKVRYRIRVGAPACDGYLGTARVALERVDGNVLWAVTASWQDGGGL